MRNFLFFSLLLFVAVSCSDRELESQSVGEVEGYRPVYMQPSEAMKVEVKGVQPLTDPGKIYWYHSYMMLADKGRGVHVIDISNPASPKKLAFISIPGVSDVAATGNHLFADNITDLVVFNISDVMNIKFVKRIEDVYPSDNQMYPAHATGYFECVDPTKGLVTEWQKVILEDPKCRR